MHTFLIAALTADGLIAQDPSVRSTTWTSDEDRKFFIQKSKEVGVLVMGDTTYHTWSDAGKRLPGRLKIIYSKEKLQGEELESTQKPPAELLKELEERGFNEVLIAGGATIYTMFMESGLVDTLYLTIEPVIFGSGLKLFNKEIDAKLELKSHKMLNENTILLEYNVLK